MRVGVEPTPILDPTPNETLPPAYTEEESSSKQIVDFDDGDQIQAYWYLNVTSVMLLNSAVNKRHSNQFCSFPFS